MQKLTFATLDFNAQNTPVSTVFDDIYFSSQDGLAESYYVFQEGNQLWERWLACQQAAFVIAETGFGTGLNFLAVAEKFQQFRQAYPNNPLKRLYFISFEKFPLTAEQLAQIHQSYPQFSALSEKFVEVWRPRQIGCQRYHFNEVYLDLWFGELAENLPQLGDFYQGEIDAWFLDGFSPDKNLEMWQESLYQQMFRLSRNGGTFATFTAASKVRKGLAAAGFDVFKRKGFGKKREMLWGQKPLTTEHQAPSYPYFYTEIAQNSDDIALVGGGVASLFLALSLLERGKKVTLYCKDPDVAMNASGNLQGAIYPQLSDDDERNVRFYIHSFDYALQRLKQLSPKIQFEQGLTGVALMAYNEKTALKLEKIAKQIDDSNLFELCTAKTLSERIGLPVQDGGAFIAEGGWLSPHQLVKNGFDYLIRQGLKIVFNHEVKSPIFCDDQWHWQWQNQDYAHDILVLTNGNGLMAFEQSKGIPLYPVRGQVSQIPTTPDLQKLQCVVCYDGYLTPVSAENTHCLGASHVRNNDERHFSLSEHQENLAKLQQNMTACDWTKNIDLSANWAKQGVRAALRDRLPIVGAVPDYVAQKQQYANLYNALRRKQAVENAKNFTNLYLINGLGSRGLTTAPLLAEMLAGLICREPIPMGDDIWRMLSPNRAWMRKLLKGSKLDE